MLTPIPFLMLLGAKFSIAIPHNVRDLITAAPVVSVEPQATLVPRWPIEPCKSPIPFLIDRTLTCIFDCTTLEVVVSVISVMENPYVQPQLLAPQKSTDKTPDPHPSPPSPSAPPYSNHTKMSIHTQPSSDP